MLRVEVDLDVCQAHGECVRVAPDLFALDGDLVLSWEHEPPAERREDLDYAAEVCPVQAITIVDD